MKKSERKKFVGYRMPKRYYNELCEVLPLYKSFSDLLTTILLNWEESELRKKQLLTINKMRFKILEKE